MGRRRGQRRGARTSNPRQRLAGNAGYIIHQYAASDNVDEYTTINITAATLGVNVTRPACVRWVKLEFSCVPDATNPSSKSHTPILHFEVCAPTTTATPRVLFRSPPHLTPMGPVKVVRYNVPYAGYFIYNANNSIVLKMICSASAALAVTFNLYVCVSYDFMSYQGLSVTSMDDSHLPPKREVTH